MLSHSVMPSFLRPHGLHPARLLCPWGFSREEHWVVCHALLQGIFPTQRSNPGLPHCRWILYQLNHQGSPHLHIPAYKFASLEAQLCKESACNAGDPGLIPESGESPGEGIVYKFYIYIYIHSPFLHKSWYTINSSFPRFSCLRVCLKTFLYQYTKHFFIKYSIVLLYTVYLVSDWLIYKLSDKLS